MINIVQFEFVLMVFIYLTASCLTLLVSLLSSQQQTSSTSRLFLHVFTSVYTLTSLLRWKLEWLGMASDTWQLFRTDLHFRSFLRTSLTDWLICVVSMVPCSKAGRRCGQRSADWQLWMRDRVSAQPEVINSRNLILLRLNALLLFWAKSTTAWLGSVLLSWRSGDAVPHHFWLALPQSAQVDALFPKLLLNNVPVPHQGLSVLAALEYLWSFSLLICFLYCVNRPHRVSGPCHAVLSM